MKQRLLFSATTYFQIVNCIQLKETVFKDCDADILIFDMSEGYIELITRLNKSKIFNKIYEINYYKYHKKKKKGMILLIIKVLIDNTFLIKFIENKSIVYDRFLFNNFNIPNINLIHFMKKNNENIIIERFEEGCANYMNEAFAKSKIVKFLNLIGMLKGVPPVPDIIQNMYYYCPELVLQKTNWNKTIIPAIEFQNEKISKILQSVFLPSIAIDEYNFKYIFFEESFYEDGKDIGDLEMIVKIANKVGKENFLVKLHPRTHQNRFEKYGIRTNQTVGVPFEVLQITQNFKNTIFMTITSSCTLSSGIATGYFSKTCFLYRSEELKSFQPNKEFVEYLEKYNNLFNKNQLNVPIGLQELFDSLDCKGIEQRTQE